MKNKTSILMLTDSNSPIELLEQALDALNKEHQRRLQNQGTSYGHDRYQKRAEKKIADYENAILILSKKEVKFISSKPDVIKSGCTHQFKYAAEDVMYRCVNCDAEVKQQPVL